jgi:hypothetical protein
MTRTGTWLIAAKTSMRLDVSTMLSSFPTARTEPWRASAMSSTIVMGYGV